MIKKIRNGRVLRPLLPFILFSIILLLVSCKNEPDEIVLSFETIEQRNWPGTENAFQEKEPMMIVVSQSEDVIKLDGLISEQAKTKLQSLDYTSYFVVVVFQGLKPTTEYMVNVEKITRLENTVNVYSQFLEPDPEMEKGNEVTSPYHLIQINKREGWDQNFTFNLIVGKTTLVSFSYYIP